MGFNSHTKKFENLVASGVVDPVKVVKNALTFGAGAANILLSAQVGVVNDWGEELGRRI